MKKNDQVMVCGAACAFVNAEGLQTTSIDRAISTFRAMFSGSDEASTGVAGASRVAVAH